MAALYGELNGHVTAILRAILNHFRNPKRHFQVANHTTNHPEAQKRLER
jgi:hypothetical protein